MAQTPTIIRTKYPDSAFWKYKQYILESIVQLYLVDMILH